MSAPPSDMTADLVSNKALKDIVLGQINMFTDGVPVPNITTSTAITPSLRAQTPHLPKSHLPMPHLAMSSSASVSDLPAFSGAAIDSRTVTAGSIFFALKGEQVDGHRYCAAAAKNGAALIVIDDVAASPLEDLIALPSVVAGQTGIVQVESVLATMQAWAMAWRSSVDPLIIGLTGSVGKTTTKEIMSALANAAVIDSCASSDAAVWATPGNWNNHLGVPLTLLNMPASTRIAIIEMGMNHSGEIRSLCKISKPDVGVITAVAAAHTAFFDSIEDIAAAKAEIWEKIPEAGAYVYAHHAHALLESHLTSMASRHTICCQTVDYLDELSIPGRVFVHAVKVSGLDVSLTLARSASGPHAEELDVWRGDVPLLGRHFASNLALAVAGLTAAGVTIDSHVLSSVDWSRIIDSDRRMTLRLGAKGLVIIDDTYNASPTSMRAAIDFITGAEPKKDAVVVLGPMAELDPKTAVARHEDIGRYCAMSGVLALYCVSKFGDPVSARYAQAYADGARAEGMNTHRIYCMSLSSPLARSIQQSTQQAQDCRVLVKGSRSARLDTVVAALVKDHMTAAVAEDNIEDIAP